MYQITYSVFTYTLTAVYLGLWLLTSVYILVRRSRIGFEVDLHKSLHSIFICYLLATVPLTELSYSSAIARLISSPLISLEGDFTI